MTKSILIAYDDLQKIELNQEVDINNLNFTHSKCTNVKITKILSTSCSQNFKIEIPKGCIWGNHFHDCDKNIIIYEGEIVDISNNKIINRLKPLKIKAYINHSIEAIEDSILYVEFKKPQI